MLPCPANGCAAASAGRYRHFALTLVVTHRCNLRCDYCYAGRPRDRSLPSARGRRAIALALEALAPGGTMELGFFGGEPLLEAELILDLARWARDQATAQGATLRLALTTNGTIDTPAARRVEALPDLDLALSLDGPPAVNDRHRRNAAGRGSSPAALAALDRLVAAGREFRVVAVVNPDTVAALPATVRYFRDRGVSRLTPALNVHAAWSAAAERRLETALLGAAACWRRGLPGFSLDWFDRRLALLAGLTLAGPAPCRFGRGEVAVAPSGRLYPCEQLVGEDRPGQPLALPGMLDDCRAFPAPAAAGPAARPAPCRRCAIQTYCQAGCRCHNYARTGDPLEPDGFLCRFEQTALKATALALEGDAPKRREEDAPLASGR